jgi:anti-sigma B factor antagonist
VSPQPAAYMVARSGATVFIRSTGLANMKSAPMLDAFLATEIDQGATTICVDLSACTGMDSTFMGLLVGYARQVEGNQGRLVIVNPSPANLRLLQMLGVTLVVPVIEKEEAPAIQFVTLAGDPTMPLVQRMDLVRRAHENLTKLTPANEGKFAPFLAALEVDLLKLRNKPAP